MVALVECSWCGAECEGTFGDRRGDKFCTRSHRDASSRAVANLRAQERRQIHVELEPDDLSRLGVFERCCFCRNLTKYWTKLDDRTPGQQVACCQACAKVHVASEVPTKDAWWDREVALEGKR